MTSQPREQTITIHILPNILRSKGNQVIKFGQLIECNMANNNSSKIIHKICLETIARTFSKKSKLTRSLKFFIAYQVVEGYRNILQLTCRPLAFTSYKAFLNSRKRSGLSSLAHFCMILKKTIYLIIHQILLLCCI